MIKGEAGYHLVRRAHLAGHLDRPELARRPSHLHRGRHRPDRHRRAGESGAGALPAQPHRVSAVRRRPARSRPRAARSSSTAAISATGAGRSASRVRWCGRRRRCSRSRSVTRSPTAACTTTASDPTCRRRNTYRCWASADPGAVGTLETTVNQSALALEGSYGRLDRIANPRKGYVHPTADRDHAARASTPASISCSIWAPRRTCR